MSKQDKPQEQKPEQKKETVELKNNTYINDELVKAGTVIEVTPEIKKLLKPFGYFNS